ncbi:MAG TPA: sulfurtransferase TusA family protein [Nitrospirales bacterium]|nr:sulfurtransferase TusA family protein [Nitrospirales bacterium]
MDNLPDPTVQDVALRADEELDLRGVMCPFNFVKTKLRLEDMADGAILTVTLDPGEPLKNVPASVEMEGHTILKIEPRESHARVWIQKHTS